MSVNVDRESLMPEALDRAAPASDVAGTLEAILSGRWSCRAFRPEPVPEGTIERILSLAGRAASWCNTQPWRVVVTGAADTERFRNGLLEEYDRSPEGVLELDAPSYQGVHLERRRAVGWKLYEAVGVEPGDRAGAARQARENFRLFGAPHVAIVTSDRALGPYGVLDCGAFVQVFLLAARACGVATIAQAAIASRSEFVRRHFGLGPDRLIVCGISFGHADESHPANAFRSERAGLHEWVTWQGPEPRRT